MIHQFKILIVGGGNAGLSVAAKLLLKDRSLDIGIIEPSAKHFYQPAFTLVGAGIYDVNKTVRNEKDLIPAGAQWRHDAVVSFHPEHNEVVCESGVTYRYEILIVCPGIQLNWKDITGLKETLGKNNVSSNYLQEYTPYTWEMIKNFTGGTAVFTNPPGAIKCGGAPHKIMYLACDYWRKKGILDRCDVHYISGGNILFGIPEYAATLNEAVVRYKISTHFGSVASSIDGATHMLAFETKTPAADIKASFGRAKPGTFTIQEAGEPGGKNRVEMRFDFCHAVPPQSAPDFVRSSALADPANPAGYVEVDAHTLQHKRFPNVFSLGDSSSAPASKTGAAIRKQAPVLVDNVLAFMHGRELKARYEGYSACPIPTQYGKLMLAEFDYSNKPKMTFPFNQAKPRFSMWLLKTRVLPWLYWNKILKGKA